MAPLSYNVLVTPYAMKSSNSKVPLPKGLIKYRYKFNKSRLSNFNYKKDKAFLKNFILNDHTNYDNVTHVERGNYDPETLFLQPAPFQSNRDERDNYPNLQSYQRFMEGILEMSRPQNLAPSIALVLVGGWIGGGRSVEVLMRPGQVWIAVGCSALINMASMLVNDVFDFRSGTDQANGKTSPLLRGQVHPYHVELAAGCLYGASIIGLCYLEPMSLRLLIGVVALATYIYTPILKNLTMVKNMVVSGIVSSSILVGALAIGGKDQLQNPIIVDVALFIFLCILSRELLMDVVDMKGDKVAGVNTLAVHFGGQICTLTASFSLVAANALLISLLAIKAQVFATIGTMMLLPLHAKMLALCKELGATKDVLTLKSIQQVVQQSIIHIGFGALVLASVA